jgi:hypothetical protein
MAITENDSQEIRCPKLGGEVHFKYCRTCGSPFCPRIVLCWAVKTDIGGFLAGNYTPEQIHTGMEMQSPGKLDQILTAAQKARS